MKKEFFSIFLVILLSIPVMLSTPNLISHSNDELTLLNQELTPSQDTITVLFEEAHSPFHHSLLMIKWPTLVMI